MLISNTDAPTAEKSSSHLFTLKDSKALIPRRVAMCLFSVFNSDSKIIFCSGMEEKIASTEYLRGKTRNGMWRNCKRQILWRLYPHLHQSFVTSNTHQDIADIMKWQGRFWAKKLYEKTCEITQWLCRA